MKTTITVTKQEIEEAVTAYIFDKISAGYRHKFEDGHLHFANADGDIGNFTGMIEVEVTKKEE